jgi:L-amino acid N-acyltransferase YncA
MGPDNVANAAKAAEAGNRGRGERVNAGGLGVRAARMADAEAIRAIYNPEVVGSTVTFDLVPRTLEDQQRWLAQHEGAHPAIVAFEPQTDEVVGFGSLTPYRSRPAYSTTVEDSVYVHADHRSRGVGHLVLSELVRLGTAGGFHSIIARIVGDHEASINLHRSCGFDVIGVEKEVGRKFGRWLDVVLMQRML